MQHYWSKVIRNTMICKILTEIYEYNIIVHTEVTVVRS